MPQTRPKASQIVSVAVNLAEFNADPTGTLASDIALAAAILKAGSNGRIEITTPGTYRFTQKITKAESFDCFSIVASGEKAVAFDYTGVGTDSLFHLLGGSGQLVSAVFEGINFLGKPGCSAFKIENQDGVKMRRCHFEGNTNTTPAIWMLNSGDGFTEFNVAEDCEFAATSPWALKYSRAGGATQESFHGSGLLNCVGHHGTDFLVEIGAACLVYNAPMTVDSFCSAGSTMIRNLGSRGATLFGTIMLESGPGTPGTFALISSGPVALSGEVATLSTVGFGSLAIVDAVVQSGPEFNNVQQQTLRPTREFFTTINSGAVIGNVSPLSFGLSAALVSVEFRATGYVYRYLGYAEHNGFGASGIWSVISTGLIDNTAGYGPPTITVNAAGQIIATNGSWPAATVRCLISLNSVNGVFTSYS